MNGADVVWTVCSEETYWYCEYVLLVNLYVICNNNCFTWIWKIVSIIYYTRVVCMLQSYWHFNSGCCVRLHFIIYY